MHLCSICSLATMLSSWFRVCSQAAVTRSLTRGPAGLEYTAFPLLPSASAFSSFTGAFCTIKNNNNEIVKNSLKLPQARASLACFDGDMNRMLCLGGTGAAARRTVSASRIARRTFAAGDFHGTTILCVRKQGQVVLIGDGQVTAGHEILKHNVRKVRRIGDSGVIGGFAGTTADALTLFERLEGKLEEYPGQLRRAAVELAKVSPNQAKSTRQACFLNGCVTALTLSPRLFDNNLDSIEEERQKDSLHSNYDTN